MEFKDLQVLVVRHGNAISRSDEPYGHIGALIDFARKRVGLLMQIMHPFSYSKFLNSLLISHEKEGESVLSEFPGIRGSDLLLFLRDAIATIFFTLKLRKRFHIYVGVDSLNALVGVFLRKISLVHRVVFCVIDYTPKRFRNPLMNSLYQILCKRSAQSCDVIWNLSSRMAKVWESHSVEKGKNLIFPIGAHFGRIKRLPLNTIDHRRLVYVGALVPEKGVQLIFEALPEVIKSVPDVKLDIIGTGPLKNELREVTKKQHLEHHVDFLGFIPDYNEVLLLISRCAIGLAPFSPNPFSYAWYADPGKIKEYLACGLPVIITKVPEVASRIEESAAGFAIDYDREQLVNAIVSLLKDDELYRKYRVNAIKMASMYDWDEIFNRAFRSVTTSNAIDVKTMRTT